MSPLTFVIYLLTSLKVSGEAQGDSSSLDKFVQHLKMGPSAADVSKVDTKEISTKSGEKNFTQ